VWHQTYKDRHTHRETTDVDALKRIFRAGGRGSEAARLMLDIRSLSKRLSTYLNIGRVIEMDDIEVHISQWELRPVDYLQVKLSLELEVTSQNWPHDLLRFFLFDEGYIGYSFDLSQIEK